MFRFNKYFVVVIVIATARIVAGGKSAPNSSPMWVEKVKENLYVVHGPGMVRPDLHDNLLHEPGNVAVLVTSAGVALVDDKYATNTVELMRQIRTITPLSVRYIFNTHHHSDHAGGDMFFDGNAEIIAHYNAREHMIKAQMGGAPEIAFDDQVAVFLGGTEIQARYLGRGHTDGDSVIYLPTLRAIHTGDLVIDGMPHIDYDNGGSAIEWVKTLDRLLEMDFDVAIPGHGRLLTKEDVRTNRAAFVKMNEHMVELVKRGLSKSQATADLSVYLKEIGWDKTVSTTRFLQHSLGPYYDEIASAAMKENRYK